MPPNDDDTRDRQDPQPQPTEDDDAGGDEPTPGALLLAGAAFAGGFLGAVAGKFV